MQKCKTIATKVLMIIILIRTIRIASKGALRWGVSSTIRSVRNTLLSSSKKDLITFKVKMYIVVNLHWDQILG